MLPSWVERHTADAERQFVEGHHPEEQFSILVEGMRAVVTAARH